MASTSFDHLTKEVFVEILPARSFESQEVIVMGVDQPNWMTPYFDYLMNDILPEDDVDARKTKIKSLEYTFHNGTLYRKNLPGTMAKVHNTTRGKVRTTGNTRRRSKHT